MNSRDTSGVRYETEGKQQRTQGPVLQHVDCPFTGCGRRGAALIPSGSTVTEARIEPLEADTVYDGMVHGDCQDHHFYVYFRN
ncbi:hypothetical protein [Haloarchaeobius sp. DFWS5]|uniref:hypothetical protein n=1 Tax=Haloarchaeobius sp. DFWS5 TaxID=3446114 RepID=UPI003EBDDFCB